MLQKTAPGLEEASEDLPEAPTGQEAAQEHPYSPPLPRG